MKSAQESKKQTKKNTTPKALDGALLKRMLTEGRDELKSRVEEINGLNVFPVPDGDTGDNMLSTVDSGVRAIEEIETDDLSKIMLPLSHGMLLGARGNSGVILSQFFKGVADGFENSSAADPRTLGRALELGVKEAYETVTTPTEGTILTVAREAVEYAVSRINPKTTIKSFFADLVKELRASVERTPELLPALKDAGVVDSGGAGLFYLLDGFNRALRVDKKKETRSSKQSNNNGEGCETNESLAKSVPTIFSKINTEKAEHSNDKSKTKIAFDEKSEMQYAYCTELLVQLTRAKCDTDAIETAFIRRFICAIGDSVAVVKCGSVVKIHVHTLTPDKVLSFMLNFGEFINVKIENMSLQHSSLQENGKENNNKSKPSFTKAENSAVKDTKKEGKSLAKQRKKHGVIVVANGKGISKAFIELGADEVINLGECKSPSAHDFLNLAERINADMVFIFPNNKNFILSAEQAAKMADSFAIRVIPSMNIAEGYAALSLIGDATLEADEIEERSLKAIANTVSGCVFTAAKDTKCGSVKIKKGDVLGYMENRFSTKAKSVTECAVKLIKRLTSEKYMLTVFKGKNAADGEIELIKKRAKKSCPELEIYVIDSGQEIFDYIFGAE